MRQFASTSDSLAMGSMVLNIPAHFLAGVLATAATETVVAKPSAILVDGTRLTLYGIGLVLKLDLFAIEKLLGLDNMLLVWQ